MSGAHKRRLGRLLGNDGRTLVVALDHLPKLGREVALREPGRVLAEVAAAGADAVLVRHGLAARAVREVGRAGLILSLGPGLQAAPREGVELALRLGADGVKVEVFPGAPDLPRPAALFSPLAAVCEAWAMPLVAETIPVSFTAAEAHTPENLLAAARLGADLGADVVKTKFTGDAESFAEVVAAAGVPVVILGGAGGGERALFEAVRQALDGGAAGAAVGRRIFTSPRPGHMAGALARMIHEDLGVEAALAEATRALTAAGRPGGGRQGGDG
jgi:DhnA family fructose-bisphosphate aldolase class Ia